MGVALPLEGTFLPRSGICHSTLIYVLCEDYNDPLLLTGDQQWGTVTY